MYCLNLHTNPLCSQPFEDYAINYDACATWINHDLYTCNLYLLLKSHTEFGLPVVKLKDTCTVQASYTLSQYLAFGTDKESLFKKS